MNKYNTWIEIDSTALHNNYSLFRKLVGDKVKLCGVVKANAYGHGLRMTAGLLEELGIDYFAVHSLKEALDLKAVISNKPILIMGYVLLEELQQVVENGFRIVIYNKEMVKRLGELSNQNSALAYLHLKLETGTNRQGIAPEEILDFLTMIVKYPHLKVEGIYTHFANIEDTTNHQYAQMQLGIYRKTISEIENNFGTIPLKHTACSAAALLFPESYFDMVRVGISLYGMWPSKETYLSYMLENKCEDNQIILEPVLSWKTRVSQVKRVKKGAYLGYGCTYKTNTDSKIAVLPVGYSDGYDRKLSNNGYVLIKGQRAPIRGRVCMNITLVDVTNIIGVQVEDEVILIGKKGDEEITADFLAAQVGTINYEILSRIAPHIPRIISP